MTNRTKEELNILCQVINDTVDVNRIYLFGSYAYGTPNSDSDYDICVVIPDGDIRPIDAMKKIRRALYDKQKTPLDLLVYYDSRFEFLKKNVSLENKIASEGVMLYERPKFVQRMV